MGIIILVFKISKFKNCLNLNNLKFKCTLVVKQEIKINQGKLLKRLIEKVPILVLPLA